MPAFTLALDAGTYASGEVPAYVVVDVVLGANTYDLTGATLPITLGLDPSAAALTGAPLAGALRAALASGTYAFIPSTETDTVYTPSGFSLPLEAATFALSPGVVAFDSVSPSTPGAYTFTPADLTLTFVEVGVFTLPLNGAAFLATGAAATLIVASRTEPGAYQTSGAALTLAHGSSSEPGVYQTTGAPIGLLVASSGEPGVSTMTLAAATLTFTPAGSAGFTLPLNEIAFGLTGAGLRMDAAIVSVPGAYTFTPAAMTPIHTPAGVEAHSLTLEPASFTVVGNVTPLVLEYISPWDPGLYLMTLAGVSLIHTPATGGVVYTLGLDPMSFMQTGAIANQARGTTLQRIEASFVPAAMTPVYTPRPTTAYSLILDPNVSAIFGALLGRGLTMPAAAAQPFAQTGAGLALGSGIGLMPPPPYLLTGAPLAKAVRLALDAGNYAHLGVIPTLIYTPITPPTTYSLPTEGVIFAFNPADVTLTAVLRIHTVEALEPIGWAFIPSDATLATAHAYSLDLASAAFVFTDNGAEHTFTHGHNIQVDLEQTAFEFTPGELILDYDLRADVELALDPGGYAFVGAPAGMLFSGEITTRPPSLLASRRRRPFVSTTRGTFPSRR
jgi:hypothetical protein